MKRVPVKIGFSGKFETIEVDVPDAAAEPWGADTTLSQVGKSRPRINGEQIVRGAARFATDVASKGMLYARFLRCPHGHARVVKGSVPVKAGVRYARVEEGKECFFAGDDVGIVVAETQEIADEAAASARIEYEVMDHIVALSDAVERGGNRGGPKERAQGDLDEGFAAAAVTLERTYATQVQTHSCLETHSYVAREEDGRMTVWASTQSVQGARDELSGITGGDARVVGEYVGGGFGAKFGLQDGAVAARLARETGAPVKLHQNRAEEHTSNGNRPSSIQKIRAGVKSDGTLTAWHVESHGTGGYSGRGGGVANPVIYEFGSVKKSHTDVRTNGGPAAAFRAPGHPQGVFAIESMLDELADAIGMDPLELRRRNDPNPVRQAQYTIGAERIGWSRRVKSGSATGVVRRGLGMGSAVWGGTGGGPAEIGACLYPDGSIEFLCGAQDIGTGTRTAIAIVAGEELGIDASKIRVRIGESDLPYGPGSGGSVTAASILPAVREAAAKLKAEIVALAERELGGDYVYRRGAVEKTSGGEVPVVVSDLARRLTGGKLSVTAARPKDFRRFRGGVAGCQFAEVEVDTETGIVRVTRVVAVQDCGLVVNPLAAEGQIQGGVIQGISYALFEERVLDRATGAMLNADFLNYKIAGSRDVPEIEVVLFDVSNGGNSAGVLGLGEPPTIPTAGAVANAVANAIGVRIRSLPITPDKVLEALR